MSLHLWIGPPMNMNGIVRTRGQQGARSEKHLKKWLSETCVDTTLIITTLRIICIIMRYVYRLRLQFVCLAYICKSHLMQGSPFKLVQTNMDLMFMSVIKNIILKWFSCWYTADTTQGLAHIHFLKLKKCFFHLKLEKKRNKLHIQKTGKECSDINHYNFLSRWSEQRI